MVEGWGLYVENMVGEHGFYLTPEAKLAQLNMRLFRAGRIVVDTSLHLGEMSIDEATTFMAERCGFPVPTALPRGAALLLLSHPGLVLPHGRPGDRADGPGLDRGRERDRCLPSTMPCSRRASSRSAWPPGPSGWSPIGAGRRPETPGRVAQRASLAGVGAAGVGWTPEREIRPDVRARA